MVFENLSSVYMHEHQVPNPDSNQSGSQSTWERWSESGFESSLPPINANSLDQDLDQNPCVNRS